MQLRAKALSTGLALGALVALGAMLIGGTTAASAGSTADTAAKKKKKQDKCDPNTEMIIDDSGSNSDTDPGLPGNPQDVGPGGFRGEFGELYVNYPLNQGDTLGAVRFDHAGYSMFPPLEINAANRPTMIGYFNSLSANGGTNYDAGFALGNAENRKANNRIFMSDGLASPPTQHVNPKIKTYVIGYGEEIVTNPSATALLSQIAADTGGEYYPASNAASLGSIMATISAQQHCEKVVTFTDTFSAVGQEFVHKIKPKGNSADVAITWPTAGTQIDGGTGAELFVSDGNAQVSKAKSTGKVQGSTYTTFRIKGLKKKKRVTVKVKATALPAPTTATTQVVR